MNMMRWRRTVSYPFKYEFTGDEVIALYRFLKREPLDHHIPGLIETVRQLCEMAEHELASRDSKTT
jgi:hypothetical protein